MSALSDVDVRAVITASITETFSTRLSKDLMPVEWEPPPASGIQRIAGTLSFEGKVTGILIIQTTLDFGRLMASDVLGVKPGAMDFASAIRDLIAEITRIVAGKLKSALTDSGHPCVLSPLHITSGSDFSITSLNMDRIERLAFRKDSHVVIVELGLRERAGSESSIDFHSPEGAGRMPNPALQKLDATDLNGLLAGAVVDVFGNMLSLKLEGVEPDSAPAIDGMRSVWSVCFAGDAVGVVSLHIGQDFSRLMAANLPSVEPEESRGKGEIGAVLGELGAVIGGNLISALTDTGLRCLLCTPTLTSGSDFRLEPFNCERFKRWAFRCEGHFAFVEMGLRLSDQTAGNTDSQIAETADAAPGSPAAASTGASIESAPQTISGLTDSGAEKTQAAPEDFDLELLLDIPVELMVELGRTKMTISELLTLQPGSAVKLSDLEGDPVDILANDVLIARGEVVVRNEKYGIRITEITSRAERLKGLK